jgi:hypothetical protein
MQNVVAIRGEKGGRRGKGKHRGEKIKNKIVLFGHPCFVLKQTHSLFPAWSLLLVHIQLTPSEGPKGFKNFASLRNLIMEGDREKGSSIIGQLHDS